MKYFTVKEAAEQLALPRRIVYKLVSNGKLHAEWISKKEMRIAEENIIKFKENDISRTHYPISIASQKLNMSSEKTRRLLKLGTFPNSIKVGKIYYISKKDILSFKNLLQKKKSSYTVEDISKVLNITISNVRDLIKRDIFPNAFKLPSDKRYYIPKEDIESHTYFYDNDSYLTLEQASKELNLQSEIIQHYIDLNKFPNAFQDLKNRWFIPKKEIENSTCLCNDNNSYFTTEQASKELNFHPGTILNYIKSDTFPNAFQNSNNIRLIPKEDIEYLKARNTIPENYMSVEETATRIAKHPAVVKKYIRDGTFFQNRIILKRRAYIPLTDIIDYEATLKIPEGFITVQDACIQFDKEDSSILSLIHNGEFPNAYFNKFQKRYLIPEKELADYINREATFKDYISIKDCAHKLSCTEKEVLQMIKNGTLKFTKKNFKGETFISAKDLLAFLSLTKANEELLTLEQASKELEMPNKTLLTLIQNEELEFSSFSDTNSYELNSNTKLLIPKGTINSIKSRKKKNCSTIAIELYNRKIKTLHYKKDLKNTINLYNEFVLLKISQTRGQEESFTDKVRSLFNNLNSIILNLRTEIILLTDEEIEEVLNTESIPRTHKQNFIQFLNYCCSKVQCTFKNTYKIEYNEKLKRDKEIYDKQTFLAFYTYANNIDLHIAMAKRNKQYAQTWLFVIMHMINGWRKSTIVTELPNLPLEEIEGLNIYNLEQLKDNGLSINQAQSIVNYYYVVCKKIHISKTGSLGQFLCNEDMIIPAATALLICELHRRNYKKQDRLLGSLSKYSNSHSRFHTFFNKNKKLPEFNSLIMNRSLLTHFFYTVTNYGKHSEISHELTKNLRNHRNINSITAYVQSTNCDGTLDVVSLNLFNRGTFGWLYNFIIDLAMDKVTEIDLLENRTSIIQVLKHDYSPSQLEDISFLLLKYQNERAPIVDKLMQLPKDQVIEIIIKILKGEKPSKTKHVQCITYPQCSFPNFDSCLNCPNAIFNVYLLISIVEELKNIHTSIKSTNFDTIRYRDTIRFILILDIINQAISEFGKSYIETFINFEVFENIITEANKYFLFDCPNYHISTK
ncbi:helix-turn-helix domain-containing protein [Bacillus cereus]|uniref:Excisionase family DNA binding domain-containing protein n=1 Tax=Bacillus cereus HuA2-1 TaxID=1053201 RepID=J9C8T6_BACCE|nr:helix-turn-helix domain-containing protein [Bacillus cereus]EJV87831.1 excisionase family DNA binding domain-containing protein [Bacillus cereus HuA2-1]